MVMTPIGMRRTYQLFLERFPVLLLLLVVGSTACLLTTAQAATARTWSLKRGDALLVIDVQNDFMEKAPIRAKTKPAYPIQDSVKADEGKTIRAGSLSVGKTVEIIDDINCAIRKFESKDYPTYFSLDWHPKDHCSFCRNGTADTNPGYYHKDGSICGPLSKDTSSSAFPGLQNLCVDNRTRKDFDNPQVGVMQWPDHCQAQAFGSRFHPYLKVPHSAKVIKKGYNASLDAYSAFSGSLSKQMYPFDTEDSVTELNGRPDLAQLLVDDGVRRLFIVGIATDYCVKSSAVDAMALIKQGNTKLQDVVVVLPLTRWVSPTTRNGAIWEMVEAGATIQGKAPLCCATDEP